MSVYWAPALVFMLSPAPQAFNQAQSCWRVIFCFYEIPNDFFLSVLRYGDRGPSFASGS